MSKERNERCQRRWRKPKVLKVGVTRTKMQRRRSCLLDKRISKRARNVQELAKTKTSGLGRFLFTLEHETPSAPGGSTVRRASQRHVRRWTSLERAQTIRYDVNRLERATRNPADRADNARCRKSTVITSGYTNEPLVGLRVACIR